MGYSHSHKFTKKVDNVIVKLTIFMESTMTFLCIFLSCVHCLITSVDVTVYSEIYIQLRLQTLLYLFLHFQKDISTSCKVQYM